MNPFKFDFDFVFVIEVREDSEASEFDVVVNWAKADGLPLV